MTVAVRADGSRGGAGRGLLGASLTSREKELLAVTLQVLSETGYDKLTVDQVVAREPRLSQRDGLVAHLRPDGLLDVRPSPHCSAAPAPP